MSTALPRWDLSTIYPNLASPAFRNDLDALMQLVSDLESVEYPLKQTGEESAAMFNHVVTHYDSALLAAWKLDSYVAALLDTDAADPLARTTEGEVHAILARLTILGQRFASWIGGLDIETLISRSPLARDLAYPLRRLVERASHVMSAPEESLAAALHLSGGAAWSRLRRDVTSSMRARLGNGDTVRLVSMGELRVMASAPDRATRRAAYEAECAVWSANAVVLAAALNGVKGEAAALSARRGWPSPLDEALWTHGLDRPMLDALMTATREALPTFCRFLAAKATHLGLPTLAWYDLTAPVAEGGTQTFAGGRNPRHRCLPRLLPATGRPCRTRLPGTLDRRRAKSRQTGRRALLLAGRWDLPHPPGVPPRLRRRPHPRPRTRSRLPCRRPRRGETDGPGDRSLTSPTLGNGEQVLRRAGPPRSTPASTGIRSRTSRAPRRLPHGNVPVDRRIAGALLVRRSALHPAPDA